MAKTIVPFTEERPTLHNEQQLPTPQMLSKMSEGSLTSIGTLYSMNSFSLFQNVEMSFASLHRVIADNLCLLKVCARWVPRLFLE